ncbi:uncharacterized protein EDB91DRAFT_1243477 [Suillus paluster]|uniref:uncharacterized protein n=1 Tax=Suillus paluster TaxID=48578 RepID=UPI001B881FDD|nr:uncharacterized protein EDB91DRAFT_1243477 [Suillus paluster]KAG1752712.1 hypothetical protein EDB91DRAFT_1243477 [Suillus paluster]
MSDTSLNSPNSPFIMRGPYYPRRHCSSLSPELEALEHELMITAENTVTAIGWSADGELPAICEFQTGFVLPRIRVTADWLRSLGLADDSCYYYNTTHECWRKIIVGHVLTLTQPYVYLKNLNVKVTLDFDIYVQRQPQKQRLALPYYPRSLQRIKREVSLDVISISPDSDTGGSETSSRGLSYDHPITMTT